MVFADNMAMEFFQDSSYESIREMPGLINYIILQVFFGSLFWFTLKKLQDSGSWPVEHFTCNLDGHKFQ